MEQNVPINKGNYSMDTIEREQLFEEYRGYGWEKEYKIYRENWIGCAKEKKVLDYPLNVDIELSTVCNLHCPMCYTNMTEFKKNVYHGFMEFNLYKKIIDEIRGHVPAIRLSLRGESTLHPDFVKCIHYAKQAGIREVSTLTNASKLDSDYFEKIMLAGIDWITISVDGLQEEYEKIRVPLKFSETLRKIKEIYEIKLNYSVHRPVIKIQAVWPSIRNTVEEFYETFSPYVDLIAFNPLANTPGSDKYMVYDDNFSCPQIYQRLVIGSDGKVMLCSNDEMGRFIIGDVHKESVHAIWHGEALTNMRRLQKMPGGFKQHELCRICYLPRLTEPSEKGYVHGREFYVDNYVGGVRYIEEIK